MDLSELLPGQQNPRGGRDSNPNLLTAKEGAVKKRARLTAASFIHWHLRIFDFVIFFSDVVVLDGGMMGSNLYLQLLVTSIGHKDDLSLLLRPMDITITDHARLSL